MGASKAPKLVEPLTIVHVLTSYEIGGGEQVALNLAAEQVGLGHRVHVVALDGPPNGPHAANFSRAGITAHRVRRLGSSVDPSLPLRLSAFFWRLGADIVHTHNPLPLIYAGAAARLLRVPVIHTKHGLNAASARRVWLRRMAGRTADKLVAVSNETAEDARRDGDCPPERLTVVPNGIALEAYAPDANEKRAVRRELGIPEAAWVVGSVGRLSPEKNQGLLVRAIAPLLSESFRLVLVGDGPARSDVEKARLALPHADWVHLLGQRQDVPRLLKAFDVFALSSDTEGLPMVLPEAMATCLPVVSTRVGGIGEVIDEGRTGYLVARGDEEGLRERLRVLFENRARAFELGQQARKVALARFSSTEMTAAYLRLYSQVLAERQRVPS
jgi:glycosyltransferase involved in cell wall biosynthesis